MIPILKWSSVCQSRNSIDLDAKEASRTHKSTELRFCMLLCFIKYSSNICRHNGESSSLSLGASEFYVLYSWDSSDVKQFRFGSSTLLMRSTILPTVDSNKIIWTRTKILKTEISRLNFGDIFSPNTWEQSSCIKQMANSKNENLNFPKINLNLAIW